MIEFYHKEDAHATASGLIWRGHASAVETYRDTSASDLLGLVSDIESGVLWRDAVRAKYESENPWLYRIVTDHARDLFIRQFPVPPESLILDVGAGWGQYTLPLARTNRVVSVEPTPERLAFIYAAARQDGVAKNVYFLEASMLDLSFIQRFDCAYCIGVLEWVPKFHEGDPWGVQREFLISIRKALRRGGRVFVGIENRMGLKYILGANDDHIAIPNVAVLDSALASERYFAVTGKALRSFTYTLPEYCELFRQSGFAVSKVRCAFPDYKIPSLIIDAGASTDACVLRQGTPFEHDGSNGCLLPTEFQAVLGSHYRTYAQMGVSALFAPSYFFELCELVESEQINC